ncbi:hypothetical protein PV10_05904 [Exophiala mesophila]|uniref:Single-stranded DNA-binding protein RIM1, mitochondrial n=1 Tax=Exophiala mesophila TaxID=212818 RepID=A0A0D1ZX11_EXOME|nr:uncharacterized protein PV10_05904 [Exophiala mesophila]KIV91358.1 hypothetical protein PV10_05904 [Exophiala mesophila]
MSFFTRQMATKVPKLSTTARAFSTSRPSQLARITVIGRLGADAESSETAKGNAMIKYVIGSNSGTKENPETSWFRVVSFPKTDASKEYLSSLPKGTLVYVEGDVSMQSYQDNEGIKRTGINIVQSKLEVLKRNSPKEEE